MNLKSVAVPFVLFVVLVLGNVFYAQAGDGGGGNPPVPNTVLFRVVDSDTYDPDDPAGADVIEKINQNRPLNQSPTYYGVGHTVYIFKDLQNGRKETLGLYRVVGIVHGLFETVSDPPGPRIFRFWNENTKHPYAVDVIRVR